MSTRSSLPAADSTPPSGRRVNPRRKTIAVLLDYMSSFGGGYEAHLREAFHARCREKDIDLCLVYGRPLGDGVQTDGGHNAIFDLANGAVDGVVVVSSLLACVAGYEGVRRFVETRRGTPLCSFGIALPGVPSVVLDNGSAIARAVDHLVERHGRRRLAFLGGPANNPEAQLRLRGYRDALARQGIPFDPSLCVASDFMKSGGISGVERLLARGANFDAVVVASDSMALGAIDALRRHGHRVPRHVPVTGFDDLALSRLANPPLTTIGQPFGRMAALALDLVVDQIEGRPVQELNVLPGELVVRQSCGCTLEMIKTSFRPPMQNAIAAPQLLDLRAKSIRAELARILSAGSVDGSRAAARLVDALAAELAGEADAFIGVIEDLLAEIGEIRDDNERHRALQSALIFLRGEFGTSATPELDEMWHATLTLVAITNTTVQAQHRLALDEDYLRLLFAGEHVSTAFDLVSLKNALSNALPSAGVQTAFLSRYVGSDTSELEAFVCLLDGRPREPSSTRFRPADLIPPGVYPEQRRRTLIVFPLVFEAQCLGVAGFEYAAGRTGYNVLRDQIAAALRSVALHEELVQKSMQHERSLQERLATSKRMQSLSVLAGGVAHDLNNALGPLVALPEIILRDLAALDPSSAIVRNVRADLESIKTASLRASQTIKDLLTLGRQGRVTKEPFDLNRIVAGSLSSDTLRFLRAANPDTEIEIELCSEPLVIHASEPHVARAVTNLVRNAVEAIQGRGKVVVATSLATVREPMPGYERIEPGDYARLTISDDGCGIAPHELTRVFEPFFSNKPIDDERGTGLGLAIVHGVVKEHDGFLDVASSVGKGTTFTLYFPRTRESPKVREIRVSVAGGRAALLLVDDDPIQLRTGRRILTHFGYHVDTVPSGRVAYEIFVKASRSGASPYDLVVFDMALNEPEDGLEIFDRVRRLFPEQRAIVASGHAPNERLELAVARGLAVLSKPYTAEALAHAVECALAERPSTRLRAALSVL